MAIATLIAFRRSSTIEKDISLACALSGYQVQELLTTAAIAHNAIQDSHKLGNDMVHLVEARKYRDDV